jgi:alpha-glucosidase (family GH31 glycosyl hydrolase)
LLRENSGLHHLGYLRTTNAVDVEVESFSNSSYMQIFRIIGGIIDFRYIVGEKNPEELLKTFHGYIGSSLIPPFWSLGFHQCRWGYTNITALETVITKFKENDIPLDTIWSDIDYMHDF